MTLIKYLDKCTLDLFKLDIDNKTSYIQKRGLDAVTLDQFTLDARKQLTTENSLIVKWGQAGSVYPECKIRYSEDGRVYSQTKIKYNQKHFVTDESKIKYRQVTFVDNNSILKWNQFSPVYPQIGLKWNQNGMLKPTLSVNWDQHSYISNLCKIKYYETLFVSTAIKLAWRQTYKAFNQVKLKWQQKGMSYPNLSVKWDQNSYISNACKVRWLEGSTPSSYLINYLEVITLQGSKMYPIIEDASIEKGVDIDTAKMTIFENVPPYSLCKLYVNYNIFLFEGISLSCPKKGNVYELEVVNYLEHIQPNSPKPGLYLRKYEWEDVQVQHFLSSDKPTDNNNTLGLLYMANSVIPHVLFESYDVNNHIYVWAITGSPYTITEIFEDTSIFPVRTSITQLLTLPGWYYDSIGNKLYVRHTGDTSPYDYVLTIPNIWDGPMPIRLGVLATTKGSTVIKYAQTADFDIPLETMNMYLYSLGLEYESSVRGGITYIDISEYRGSGSIEKPANTYVTSKNILKINEIDSNNAKYSTNGVFFQGYGSGAGSITAGLQRNMNVGGRFVFLEDPSVHGEAQATDYVSKYLEEMYLPAQTITFEAPLDILGIYDNRSVGDYIKIIIPVEEFVEDLRIQKLQIFLKDSIIKITAGDRLFSLEQRLKAIKSANEKYRKHLEDTTEEISLNWDTNIDSGLVQNFDFEIKDNTLSVQRLEISYDVSKMIVDSSESSPTSCPEGGGDGGGGMAGPENGTTHSHKIKAGEKTDVSTMTIEVAAKIHLHSLSLANMGAPTSSTLLPTVHHKHPSGTLVNGIADNATLALATLLYGNCTAPNCVRTFACGDTTVNVSSASHLHAISGNTGEPDLCDAEVAGPGHRHTGTTDNNTTGGTASHKDHDHNIGGKLVEEVTDQVITMPESNSWTVPSSPQDENGDWLNCNSMAEIPSGYGSETEGGNYKFDPLWKWETTEPTILSPDMYLDLSIVSGTVVTPIPGSPFIVSVTNDSKKSGGPILIDSIITTNGKYQIRAAISNKTVPGSACRCKLAVRLNGRIFVDTIYSG